MMVRWSKVKNTVQYTGLHHFLQWQCAGSLLQVDGTRIGEISRQVSQPSTLVSLQMLWWWLQVL